MSAIRTRSTVLVTLALVCATGLAVAAAAAEETSAPASGNPDAKSVPTVSSLTPNSGPVAGGTFVTIKGNGFETTGFTEVLFDDWGASAVTVKDSQTITCWTPDHIEALGAVPVTVENPSGSSVTIPNAFTYLALYPMPDSISPVFGSVSGGTHVQITGVAFSATGTRVTMGGVEATGVQVTGTGEDMSISCQAPPHAAGIVDIVVTSPNSGKGVLAKAFEYCAATPPAILDILPRAGTVAGGTPLKISGSGFYPEGTIRVLLDGLDCTDVSLHGIPGKQSLSCTTPAHAEGYVGVTVINPNASAATLPYGFHFTTLPPPQITSFSPHTGHCYDATGVTIRGSSFFEGWGTHVLFGDVEVTNAFVANNGTALEVRCSTPLRQAPGEVQLAVVNPDGQVAVAPTTFSYFPPLSPYVWSAIPGSGSSEGGYYVSLRGLFRFNPTASVQFDGIEAEFIDQTFTLACKVPPHAPGVVNILVKDVAGWQDSYEGAFTYLQAPPQPRFTADVRRGAAPLAVHLPTQPTWVDKLRPPSSGISAMVRPPPKRTLFTPTLKKGRTPSRLR